MPIGGISESSSAPVVPVRPVSRSANRSLGHAVSPSSNPWAGEAWNSSGVCSGGTAAVTTGSSTDASCFPLPRAAEHSSRMAAEMIVIHIPRFIGSYSLSTGFENTDAIYRSPVAARKKAEGTECPPLGLR